MKFILNMIGGMELGPPANIIKRVIKEIEKMKEKNYSVEILNNYSTLIVSRNDEITNKKTNKYIITLNSSYPFHPPYINDYIDKYPNPQVKLDEYIEKANPIKTTTENPLKMVVYCHRKRDYHFATNIMNKILNENGYGDLNNILKMYLDIEPHSYIPEGPYSYIPEGLPYGPHIIADGFSDTFINNHLNMFDIVALPDCAGDWYTYVGKEPNIEKILELIIRVLKIVKDDGIIFFSKLLEMPVEDIISRLFLKNVHINYYYIDNENEYKVDWLVIKKN